MAEYTAAAAQTVANGNNVLLLQRQSAQLGASSIVKALAS